MFITDLYQQNNEIMNMLALAASLRHEVIVLHVMADNELNLNYGDYTVLEDLETHKTIKIDPEQQRHAYKQNLNQYLSDIRHELLEKNISYKLLKMNEPVDTTLRDFLNQRNKLR